MKIEKFSLKNKWSIITGAAGLLGYYHAEALLEIGANVILTDIDLIKLKKTMTKLKKNQYESQEIICLKMDVTNEKSIISAINKILKKNISIEILINNAALNPVINNKKNDLEDFKLNKWNKELAVGLTGAFLCSKHIGNHMVENKEGGVIINISSDLSIIAPNHNIYKTNLNKKHFIKPVTYSVIKHGIIGLTKYLSTYWNSENIRCNALSPGGVKDNQDKKFIKNLSRHIPMGRMANKDEYKGAIQFLASDASSYLNGQNIIIDGGRSIW